MTERAALNFQFKPDDQAFKPRQDQSLPLQLFFLFEVITVLSSVNRDVDLRSKNLPIR